MNWQSLKISLESTSQFQTWVKWDSSILAKSAIQRGDRSHEGLSFLTFCEFKFCNIVVPGVGWDYSRETKVSFKNLLIKNHLKGQIYITAFW
jgi:hypothetical protein